MQRDIEELSPITWSGVDDVLIVGGGLAGLFTALRLAPRPVTVLAPVPIGEGASSAWAQGGIAAAVTDGDSPEAHAADTIKAGAGLVEHKIAHLLAREAPGRIEDLLRYGVPFDRDLEGRLAVSREAAHSARRVVHVRGDMAGRAIMEALIAAVRATPSIRLLEGFEALQLRIEGRYVTGLVASAPGGKPVSLPARAVVLASGGVGHLFAVTTNPVEARGAGLAMAARVGAVIADPEFVQFHPTAIAVGRDPAPLATEALRGEGAVLVNRTGERFMLKVHADGELAPRDVVARAVFAEVKSGRGALLDTRSAIGRRFPALFPKVYEECRAAGLDPTREPIPVAPAAHYHMGGVLADASGRTSLDGLWVVGEVASTGAHGANRLASNSLLEAVVFGARAAEDINGLLPSPRLVSWPRTGGDLQVPLSVESEPVGTLRRLMSNLVGVVRTAEGLRRALIDLEWLEREGDGSARYSNMVIAARLIAAAAFARTESRGGHYRADYPASDPGWQRRTIMTLADADAITAELADRRAVA